MTAAGVGLALLLLGVLALIGAWLRASWSLTQKLFLPVSLIAGLLALILGPEVLGRIAGAFGNEGLAAGGLFGEDIMGVWSSLPGLLISVVFATLFLGSRIPSPKSAVRLLGPQLSLGVTFASGQYVIGILLVVLLLGPLFGVGPEFGALLEIGFEGGHGTAAGMAPVMTELGFAEGGDLALTMATVGMVSGVIIGVILVNWAARTGRSATLDAKAEVDPWDARGIYAGKDKPDAGRLTFRDASVETLTIHVGIVGLAIILGQLLLSGLRWLEQAVWADRVEIFAYVPLFPLAMLGGVAIQVIIDRFDTIGIIDRGVMERIQGLALDILIIAALATLSLSAVADNIAPFAILALMGIVWNVVVLLVFAPRFIRTFWFERGIADFGQSQGVTATGLMLLRMADPKGQSPAYQGFGYKQLVFEPFFGGGLVTAASIPLLIQFGPYPLLIIMIVLLAAALLSGFFYFGRKPQFDIGGDGRPVSESRGD
ncbi:MAG: sodium:glutamate symporter [Micrococcus sp.]|nr:sodium:glutamate symporter [Micrococcus sp.]